MHEKKLKLNQLSVKSFTTTLSRRQDGAVQGGRDGIHITPIEIPIGPDTMARSCLHACATNEYITCAEGCQWPQQQGG